MSPIKSSNKVSDTRMDLVPNDLYFDDFYSDLNCSPLNSKEQITTEYRKLCLQYHPDKNPTDLEIIHRFEKIRKAYDVLNNDETRALYDKYRQTSLAISFDKWMNLFKSGEAFHWQNPKDSFTITDKPPNSPRRRYSSYWTSAEEGSLHSAFRNYEL